MIEYATTNRIQQPRPIPATRRIELQQVEKRSWAETCGEFLGEHPLLAISAGMAIGIALGILVKRR